MSTLVNIPRSHIQQGQVRKELTANVAMDAIAARMTDQATIDLTGETTSTTLAGLIVGTSRVLRLVSADESLTILFPLDATYDAEDPTALEGEWTVVNASGYAHTLQAVAGSETITVANGYSQLVRFDGAELYPIGGPVPTGFKGEYHAQVSSKETLTAGQASNVHLVMVPARLLATAPGSTGYAGAAPTGDTVLAIHKNGVSVGTVTFAAAASSATFSVASDVDFAAGDRLQMVGPDPADNTFADFSINLKLMRI